MRRTKMKENRWREPVGERQSEGARGRGPESRER